MNKRLILQLLVVSAFAGTQSEAISIEISSPIKDKPERFPIYTIKNNTNQPIYVKARGKTQTILPNYRSRLADPVNRDSSSFIVSSDESLLRSELDYPLNAPKIITVDYMVNSTNYTVNP